MPANTTGSGSRAVQPSKATPKVKAPTKIAQAQEQQYASQGRSVQKQANAQRQVRVRAQQLATSKPVAGDAPQTRAKDTQRAQAYVKQQYVKQAQSDKAQGIVRAPQVNAPYVKGTTVPPDVAADVKFKGATAAHKASIVGKVAPVLKVLDQTTRPLHAVAGAADAAVTGRNVLDAASRGIQNKDRTTFSDVLKDAGVKNKTVRGIAGFALDVAADPTTYLTGGVASVGRHAAVSAAEGATKKAVKAGLTSEQAARFGERAAKQAEAKAPTGSGVSVKVAGHEVPGVVRATAKVAQPLRAAGRAATPEKVRNAVRSAAGDVNPNIAPVGVPTAVHQAEVTATRTARAKTTQGERTAVAVAHGIRTQIGEKNYNAVTDAIEAGNLKTLSPELAAHAHTLRSQLKGIRRTQMRAGQKVPERQGYVPRQLTPEALAAKDAKASIPGKASTKPKSSKARVETRPMSEVRVQKPGQYREDLHALVAERLAEGHASGALAGLNQRLGDLGTAVKRGTVPAVQKGEAVFHIKAGNAPRQVTDKAEIARAAAPLRLNKAGTKVKNATPKSVGAGRYVVLNKDVVKRATEGAAPSMQGPGIIKGLDKVTSGFKRLALATPGFHLRNFTGDTAQAYVKQPGQKLAGNMVRSGRVLHELGKQEKAQRKLERPGAVAKGSAKNIQERPIRRTVLQAQRMVHGRDLGRKNWDGLAGTLNREGKRRVGKPGSVLREPGSTGKNGADGHYTIYTQFGKDGRAIGWASVHSNGGRAVYVDPAFRRQGIATKLYRMAEKDGYDIKTAGGGNTQTELGDVLNRSVRKPMPSGKTMHLPKYGHVPLEDIAKNLVAAGAGRSGYTSRELRELSKSGSEGKLSIKRAKAPAAAKRVLLNREDLPRLATAIYHLRKGASWEQAATAVAGTHFDYGHLTSFERNVARRLMPFYTWTARNIPFQTKALITNPGKYANYQKVLEEAGKASRPDQTQDPQRVHALYEALQKAGVNLPNDYRKYLSEWEQRNAGVPVNLPGGHFTLSAGLPITDLNEFPGAAGSVKGQLNEWGNKAASLVNPIIKDPVELWANYSAYFRDQIQRDTGPLVAAPSFVGAWPASVRKKLGVAQGMDPRSGKTVWKWPGKVDYVSKNMLPGLGNQAQQLLTQGTDRRGRGTVSKVAGVAGLKSVPIDPVTNATNLAFARQHDINVRLAALRQENNPANGRPIGAKNPTVEYARLSQQFGLLAQAIYAAKVMRGDVKLPTRGGPPKVRGTAPKAQLGGTGGGKVRLGGASSGSRAKLN